MFDSVQNSLVRATRHYSPLKILRRFVRHEDGATAVEFGMVALPFIAMIFAIMETALVFFAGQVLETATATSARTIMTGQAQGSGITPNDFRKQVCANATGLFDCGKVQVETKNYASFADMSTPANGFGGPGCVVVLKVSYPWPVYVNLLGTGLASPDGTRKIVAASAFRNEPFGGPGSC